MFWTWWSFIIFGASTITRSSCQFQISLPSSGRSLESQCLSVSVTSSSTSGPLRKQLACLVIRSPFARLSHSRRPCSVLIQIVLLWSTADCCPKRLSFALKWTRFVILIELSGRLVIAPSDLPYRLILYSKFIFALYSLQCHKTTNKDVIVATTNVISGCISCTNVIRWLYQRYQSKYEQFYAWFFFMRTYWPMPNF